MREQENSGRPAWDRGCPTCKHGGPDRIKNGKEFFATAFWHCAIKAEHNCLPPLGGPRANMPAGKLWEDGGYA